jgi:DNA-binding MarR family transcriptional regulator
MRAHSSSAKDAHTTSINQACDGMAANALADFLIVSRQNLDGVLRRLEREARVTRSADAVDRRTRQVKMTSCGRILWLDLQPKIQEFYRQSLVNFRFDEQISLVHYLNKLQHDMDSLSLMPRCGPAGHSLN